MDIATLKELLPLLRQHGVFTFKDRDLEINLHSGAKVESDSPQPSVVTPTSSIQNVSAPNMPLDLADDTMNYDKILNWSGAPDVEPDPLPLTGDEPLSPEALTDDHG